MDAFEFIIQKQIQWANNAGLGSRLVGSKTEKGRRTYTPGIEENLFEPLLDSVRRQFESGDGSETKTRADGCLPKMQALHSSSALCANVFQYWLKTGRLDEIAYACGLCYESDKDAQNMSFEAKIPIDSRFKTSPNLDVLIENKDGSKIKAHAIESKFSEPYSARVHSGMDIKYFDDKDMWRDIPNIAYVAEEICPEDRIFKNLHAAQLIKHTLALKKKYGKSNFRLLYLWYDSIGEQSHNHEKEIDIFAGYAEADGIKFHALTYQELILSLAQKYRDSDKEYIQYITSRYL